MAISKWISFGNTPAATTSTTTAPPPIVVAPFVTAADQKYFGLENFGNTCYANSVLQALYFCGPFRDLIVQYPDPSAPDVSLPPLALSLPPPVTSPTSPPSKPKPVRRPSVSDPHTQNPTQLSSALGPSAPSPLPIPPSPPTLLSALRSLYLHISRNPADRGTVAPRAFIDKLKELNELFRSTMHQDAHEFLNYLLNQIVEEIDQDTKNGASNVNGSISPLREDLSTSVPSLGSSILPPPSTFNSTLVHRLFEGILTSETRCLTCETVSSRDESFLDLSIDIEQNSSVTACLRQFSASEMLCQRNKFFCDSCCDLQEAEKRMKIKRLPNVLALHLKRFKYQEDVGKYIKLTYRVAFPFELRLFNTVDDAENPDRLYELFSIVVHIGNGPHHGHYVSIVKARGTWYLFDDDSVEPIKESEIPKYFGEANAGSAYVLYYQAVDLNTAAVGVRPLAVVSPTSQDAASPTISHSISLPSTAEHGESDTASPPVPPGLPDPFADVNTPSPSPSPSPPAFTPPSTSPPLQSTPSSQPSLSLTIPISPNTVDSPAASPVTPSGSSSRGILGSLRHSPSISARLRAAASGTSSEQRKSLSDTPPVPPVPALSGTARQYEPPVVTDLGERSTSPAVLPSSPSIARSPHANGKEKEKSGTGWFKRKSLRTERPPSSASPSLGERSASLGGAGVEDNDIPWYRTTKKVARRASEAGLANHAGGLVSPISPPESSGSLRASPMSPVLRPVPEHKKSTPELMTVTKGASKASRLRPRPSTAGAAVERPNSLASPPVSLMPTSPLATRSSMTEDEAAACQRVPNNDAMPRGVYVPQSQNGRGGSYQPIQRPQTAHPPVSPASLRFSTSNGTSSTLSTNGESGSTSSTTAASPKPPKRTTRKLSLSAPILGFGRKDKEKRPQSPATPAAPRDR